jgi:hypothetical protein
LLLPTLLLLPLPLPLASAIATYPKMALLLLTPELVMVAVCEEQHARQHALPVRVVRKLQCKQQQEHTEQALLSQ